MKHESMKLTSSYNNQLYIKVMNGHFATNHDDQRAVAVYEQYFFLHPVCVYFRDLYIQIILF